MKKREFTKELLHELHAVLTQHQEDFVSRASPSVEPSLFMDIPRDQEAAVQIVVDCVAKKRELTKELLHELHAILTQHQATTALSDQFGNRIEIPLRKGAFKQFPNNTRRPDGSVREYSLPMNVESEVDNLLEWYRQFENEDPITLAAWLHERFTQIHPYQDGNGRVARVLVTFVLLRAGLLPIVIDRDLRTRYIAALETAHTGDLNALAALFTSLEKRVILRALSIDADTNVQEGDR